MSVLFWMYDLLLMHCFKLRVIVIFLAWLGLTKLVTQTICVKRFMAALCNCVLGFLLLSSIYLSVCRSVCLSIYLSICLSIYFLSFPCLISAIADCMSAITSTHGMWPIANLECRSHMCCMRLAGNAACKNCQKFDICTPSDNFVGLCLRN